jgi:hypothetical protein
MIEHDASYAGSHEAMAAVARHAGDDARAEREMEAARRGWAEADPDVRAQAAPGRSSTSGRNP